MIFNRSSQIAIRTIRLQSKAELASAAGLSPSYITELEKGDKGMPSEKALRQIATALDVVPEALFISTAAIKSWVEANADVVEEWLAKAAA